MQSLQINQNNKLNLNKFFKDESFYYRNKPQLDFIIGNKIGELLFKNVGWVIENCLNVDQLQSCFLKFFKEQYDNELWFRNEFENEIYKLLSFEKNKIIQNHIENLISTDIKKKFFEQSDDIKIFEKIDLLFKNQMENELIVFEKKILEKAKVEIIEYKKKIKEEYQRTFDKKFEKLKLKSRYLKKKFKDDIKGEIDIVVDFVKKENELNNIKIDRMENCIKKLESENLNLKSVVLNLKKENEIEKNNLLKELNKTKENIFLMELKLEDVVENFKIKNINFSEKIEIIEIEHGIKIVKMEEKLNVLNLKYKKIKKELSIKRNKIKINKGIESTDMSGTTILGENTNNLEMINLNKRLDMAELDYMDRKKRMIVLTKKFFEKKRGRIN